MFEFGFTLQLVRYNSQYARVERMQECGVVSGL